MEIRKYFGPPGTGKTTRLIQDVIGEIDKGLPPERIGYVAFTRAAAQEVRGRLLDAGFEEGQLKYFGTIHSMCYHLLALDRDRVVNEKHLKKFREQSKYRLTIRKEILEPDILEGAKIPFLGDQTMDDMVFWAYNQLRARRWGSSNVLALSFPDLRRAKYVSEVIDAFAKDYEGFKKRNDLVDFTDMLDLTIKGLLHLPVDVLFLDEAQDLYPLQWDVFEMWKEQGRPHRVRLAGDDDQCIYNWAGATPEIFINYPGQDEVLGKSYRLPILIARMAKAFIERNKIRKAKEWSSAIKEQGIFHKGMPLQIIIEFLLKHPGKTVFLLTRAKFLLEDIAMELEKEGIPYTNLRGPSPMNSDKRWAFWAVKKEKLQYNTRDIHSLLKYVPSTGYWARGAKTKIQEQIKEDLREGVDRIYTLDDILALGGSLLLVSSLQQHNEGILTGGKFSETERAYYAKVYKRFGKEAFSAPPKVTLGTIHSVKGKEADVVAIWPDITKKIRGMMGYEEGREAERRVWYVGMTRPREQLWIMRPLREGYVYSEGT